MNTYLSSNDFVALAPLLLLLLGSLALLTVESFFKKTHKLCFFLTAATLLAAIAAASQQIASTNSLLTPWLRFDQVAAFFTLFFLSVGLASVLLSPPLLQRTEASQGEYYFLLLSALFGLILIGMAADFLTLFLGLETLSIALYILCGYIKKWKISEEAAAKYFLLGSLAAAFLLYGIALIYGAVGTTSFYQLHPAYTAIASSQSEITFLAGIAFITVGLAFKAAIVPFHSWAPDVYCGATTPVTAFMAVATKAGAFAAFIIVFLLALPNFHPLWSQAITFLAVITLVYANFVAIKQKQLRRFFAYSGISHAGFLLIPIAIASPESINAIALYLVVYALATIGAFSVFSFFEEGSEGLLLSDLQGLFRSRPLLAAALAFFLLTLAGIPPTAGFFAKFYLFKLAFQQGFYFLPIVALLTTILSAFYYLRIVSVMLSDSLHATTSSKKSWPVAVVCSVSAAALLLFSLFPYSLFQILLYGRAP